MTSTQCPKKMLTREGRAILYSQKFRQSTNSVDRVIDKWNYLKRRTNIYLLLLASYAKQT